MINETEFELDDLVLKKDDIISRSLDNHILLLCPETRHLFRLNEVGAKVWELLNYHRRVRDIVNSIHNFYQIDCESALSDILPFLKELERKNLIKAG